MNADRQRRLQAKKEFKKPVSKFEEIDFENCGAPIPKGMTRAYRNTRYTVMVYDNSPTTHGPATLAMILKHDQSAFPNHWIEIQKIKNEIFGRESTAVEYYPAESQLQDRHNIYWIWLFLKGELPIPIL
jgi:hypothetical protein